MKDFFKFLVFVEFLAMIAVAIKHLIHNLAEKDPFPLLMYPIMTLFVFVIMLFAKVVIEPLANWWFDL
jgi:hypothetical protein